jgi:hypothetical protein
MERHAIQAKLIADLIEGLEVFNVRDQLDIPSDLIFERARNLAAMMLGNYLVVPLPTEDEIAEISHYEPRPMLSLEAPRTERPAGVNPYHGWSCMCFTCADAKQRDRS